MCILYKEDYFKYSRREKDALFWKNYIYTCITWHISKTIKYFSAIYRRKMCYNSYLPICSRDQRSQTITSNSGTEINGVPTHYHISDKTGPFCLCKPTTWHLACLTSHRFRRLQKNYKCEQLENFRKIRQQKLKTRYLLKKT